MGLHSRFAHVVRRPSFFAEEEKTTSNGWEEKPPRGRAGEVAEKIGTSR